MFKLIGRLLFIVVAGGVLLFLFAPQVLDNAGNSLLAAVNSSSAQGLAQLIPDVNNPRKGADLQVKVDGLQPGTQYEVTLEPGQCGGFPSRDLGAVKTDDSGSLFTTISLTPVDTSQTWFVDILQGAGGVSVACGQLEVNKNTTAQLISATSSGASTSTGSGLSSPSSSLGLPQSSSDNSPGGLPNTGVKPGGGSGFDNTTYPRKY